MQDATAAPATTLKAVKKAIMKRLRMKRYQALLTLFGVVLLFKGCLMPRPTQSIPGATAGRYESGDYSVRYFSSGDRSGRRLIMVHGTPGDAGAFKSFLQNPPEGWEVVAYDRPGLGLTTPKKVLPSLKGQAAMIEPLLKTRNGEKPILFGHSLGGPIIAQAAADYPDQVGGLIIVAGSLDPDLEPTTWWRHPLRPYPVKWLIGSSLYNSNLELLKFRDQLELLKPRLQDINIPVVIVHGTSDSLVPYENVEIMEENFPQVRMSLSVEGEGHFILWRRDDIMRQAINEFSSGREPMAGE